MEGGPHCCRQHPADWTHSAEHLSGVMGGDEFDTESQGGDLAMEFSDKAVRRGFIRKVYSIISVQLLLTVGTMALFKMNYTIRDSMNPINGRSTLSSPYSCCSLLELW